MGFDCVEIPLAMTVNGKLDNIGSRFCGRNAFVYTKNGVGKTVCCKYRFVFKDHKES
jgi:hypothetical protein